MLYIDKYNHLLVIKYWFQSQTTTFCSKIFYINFNKVYGDIKSINIIEIL